MRRQAATPPLAWQQRMEMHEKVAEKFSLDRMAADHLQLYRELLAAGAV
jgi:hypothetical protein